MTTVDLGHAVGPVDTTASRTVLVVGGDPATEGGAAQVLRRGGFGVVHAPTLREATTHLAAASVDLVVSELALPDGSGLDLLRAARDATPVVIVTARGAVEDAVAAMKLGALDFLAIPFSPAALVALASRSPRAERAGGAAAGGLTVREMERRLIVETLGRTGNNRTRAAKVLGISIRTLRNKLAEYRAQGVLPLAPEPRF